MSIFEAHLRRELVEYTKNLLRKINRETGLPYEALMDFASHGLLEDKVSGNCNAIIKCKNGSSRQCGKQGKSEQGFCTTHQRMFDQNKLYDFKGKDRCLTLELLEIGDCEYLYDSQTNKVYTNDLKNPKYLGFFDDNTITLVN